MIAETNMKGWGARWWLSCGSLLSRVRADGADDLEVVEQQGLRSRGSRWARGGMAHVWASEEPSDADLLSAAVQPESVRAGLNLVVLLGQCLPALSVHGALSGNPRFYWLSARVLYNIVTFFGFGWISACLILNGRHIYSLVEFLKRLFFFTCSGVALALFLGLSRQWRELEVSFLRAEFKTGPSWGLSPCIATRLRVITIASMILPVVEHSYLLVVRVYDFIPESVRSQASFLELMELFHKADRPYLASTLPENGFVSIIIQIVVVIGTLLGVYNDIFITLIGLAVSERLGSFTKSLNAARENKDVEMDLAFWSEARERYNRLHRHIRLVDTVCNRLILLSYVWNVGGLCLNMYSTIRLGKGSMSEYSTLAVFSLVSRVGGMSFALSSISQHRTGLLRLLYSVPTRVYCAEVRRFILQVTSDEIALTGGNAFKVTRPFLMTMVGTVITYELVLIQICSQWE